MLTPLLLWPRCGRSCARAQVPPACIDRYSSPYARPVCLTVSSCGFLGFLTLSPLSVKLGQAHSDPFASPSFGGKRSLSSKSTAAPLSRTTRPYFTRPIIGRNISRLIWRLVLLSYG